MSDPGYYVRDEKGHIQGPFTLELLHGYAAAGRLRPGMLFSLDQRIWREGAVIGLHLAAPAAATPPNFEDASPRKAAVAAVPSSRTPTRRRSTSAPAPRTRSQAPVARGSEHARRRRTGPAEWARARRRRATIAAVLTTLGVVLVIALKVGRGVRVVDRMQRDERAEIEAEIRDALAEYRTAIGPLPISDADAGGRRDLPPLARVDRPRQLAALYLDTLEAHDSERRLARLFRGGEERHERDGERSFGAYWHTVGIRPLKQWLIGAPSPDGKGYTVVNAQLEGMELRTSMGVDLRVSLRLAPDAELGWRIIDHRWSRKKLGEHFD